MTVFFKLNYRVQAAGFQDNRGKGMTYFINSWYPSDVLNVGLEQPIANGAKRTVLPGGGRKQVSLCRRVLPRGP